MCMILKSHWSLSHFGNIEALIDTWTLNKCCALVTHTGIQQTQGSIEISGLMFDDQHN